MKTRNLLKFVSIEYEDHVRILTNCAELNYIYSKLHETNTWHETYTWHNKCFTNQDSEVIVSTSQNAPISFHSHPH